MQANVAQETCLSTKEVSLKRHYGFTYGKIFCNVAKLKNKEWFFCFIEKFSQANAGRRALSWGFEDLIRGLWNSGASQGSAVHVPSISKDLVNGWSGSRSPSMEDWALTFLNWTGFGTNLGSASDEVISGWVSCYNFTDSLVHRIDPFALVTLCFHGWDSVEIKSLVVLERALFLGRLRIFWSAKLSRKRIFTIAACRWALILTKNDFCACIRTPCLSSEMSRAN